MSHKILIVEDESLIGWSMANALGRAGYDPEIVECGEAAVEKVRNGGVELVISDYHLPRMDGRDLAVQVKGISKSLPVILIGANEEEGEGGGGPSKEIDYYVDKPFNLNEIVSLVAEILEPSRSNFRNLDGIER